MGKKACLVYARGCSRTQIDLGRLEEYFEVNGWQMADGLGDAVVVVVSTCAFTEAEQRLSEAYLRSIKKDMADQATLVLCGCLPGIDAELAARHGAIPLTARHGNLLDQAIGATVPFDTVADKNLVEQTIDRAKGRLSSADHLRALLAEPRELPLHTLLTLRRMLRLDPAPLDDGLGEPFHLRAARGCASDCSYCVIKQAAGEIRSKPLEAIVRELEAGLAAGHRLFHLTAEDLGAYGRDIGLTVADLLEGLLDRDVEFQLSWDDFGPRWLIEDFPRLLQLVRRFGHKVGHAGFPVQSGSERILARMNRGYTAAEAERCLVGLARTVPGLKLTTHVIIGFPGETRADFLDTIGLIQRVGFSRVSPFVYSARFGTPAAELSGQLPYFTRALRAWELRLRLRLERAAAVQTRSAVVSTAREDTGRPSPESP